MPLRRILWWVGIVVFAAGLLFMAQGYGLVGWPANSFMINEHSWTVRGSVIAVVGLGMMIVARRLRR